MVEYKNNIHNFLNEVKTELTEEIKEQGLKTREEIDEYVYNYIESLLVYYDYKRDVELINELETELDYFELNDFVSEETLILWTKEGIVSYLNKLARVYLSEYLINEYDINEVV